MPYRQIEFRAGEYYHLYNRGNSSQLIFFEQENYLYFLRQLRKHLIPETVDAIAYCLMPNHYHLLVYLRAEELSRRMQPFVLSYTKARNKRYGRSGSLFQDPFKAIHVDREEYLVHLSRYIHLNPVEAGLVKRPEDWEFSSYREYVGLRNGTLPAPDVVLAQFASAQAYRDFVESYVESDKKKIMPFVFD
jgi:REP element-mobilizing transposase RayT